MANELETRTIKAAFWRLMPFLLLCYFFAYVDRINIGFAALTMNRDIGLSSYTYGLGAGLFFWGYFFFEVPSNLILEKVGARRWIARIMITWGILSACMMFIKGETSFLVMRFCLGVAEAGFFPGIILYLTYWFPAAYRARIIAVFMVAIPISLGLGAPLSTGIMEMHGLAGLKGWQWLFVLEGLPTILVGILVYRILPDRPRDAGWLTDQQKQALQDTIDRENRVVQATYNFTVWKIFLDPRVLGLAFIYFVNTGINLGLAFFLPQIVKSIGLTNVQTGFVTAIPYIFGTAGILVWGYWSDRLKERRISLFLALAVSAVGLGGAAYLGSSFGAVAFMALAAIGIYGAKAPFWPLPSMFLTGSSAAGGIALINSIGNLGGFAGPYIVGWAKDVTNSFNGGLYALAAMAALAAILSLVIVKRNPQEQVQAAPGPAH